ncbi:MAG: class I SAM-dependent methyltransferase [Aggregatilineaceae bacterium]
MPEDYTSVTELPGSQATREQLARLYHRYHTAGRYAAGKRVLEVACGAGLGLGYLARTAGSVVGGDYTENLLRIAQSHYRGRVPLVRLDAHHLPFRDRAFDLLILFEAIYYLAQAQQFIAESRRVLSDGGTLLIGTVNKDWVEFTPSALSTRYFSVPELRDLLTRHGFDNLEFFGAFPTTATSPKQKIVSLIRRVAVALNLVPKTLGAREHLKRLFYGNLTPLQPEVADGMAELYPLVPIPSESPNTDYKILYAVARVS